MEIFYISAALTVLGFTAYLLQIVAVWMTFKNKKHDSDYGDISSSSDREPGAPFQPPVSILKPLKGLDDNLLDNLESFCKLDYPEYEIIFSLQDHNDPAYRIARKIKDRYPEKDISIIVERNYSGLNPKINNLIPAYRAAKYDYILISDSNVMVDKNYLREIMKHMEDQEVGLVTNLIRGTGGRSIGSIFENLHLNTFILGSVCFLDRFLKMPCVIGKSMLMRKSDLESIGGLEAFKDILAEDYIIGKEIHKKGKKVILSRHMIKNVNEYWNIRRFMNRHTRWGKIRWKIGGIRYFSELLCNPVFLSFLPLALMEISDITISFALLVSVLKILSDYSLDAIIRKNETEHIPASSKIYYLLSPLKDILIGFIWFIPFVSNTVVWRGNRYIIGKNSLLSALPDTGVSALRYRIIDAIKTRFA
ncbi:MAG: ceramide glucosyltransferase [Thermodesulfovibrionales bacterium]|nr:ceramide glucosyltransferase [Thermodesulfovibrionales bacterium]